MIDHWPVRFTSVPDAGIYDISCPCGWVVVLDFIDTVDEMARCYQAHLEGKEAA